MNESYWQKTAYKEKYPTIDQNKNVDIVIIGGGLTGISLAYRLRKAMFSVVVLEKDEIGSKTSGHTTAKVTYLHDLIYQILDHYYGYPYAKMFYESNKEALEEIEDIINKENIHCDYKKNENVLYTLEEANVDKMKKEKEILESFGVNVKDNVIKDALYSISVDKQGIFHPLKYLYSLAAICQKDGIQIYEHSKVEKVSKYHDYFHIDVNHHKIQCDYVVHATRYPFVYRGLYFMKLMQQREYVRYGISKNIDGRSLLCIDNPSVSERPIEKGKLIIGKNDVLHPIEWFAQDSEAIRVIPYIGKFNHYDEYMAFGYRKWGMTLSHVASKLISDQILGIENQYTKLYSFHHHSIPLITKQFPLLLKDVKKGMIDNHFPKEIDHLKKNEGAVIKKDHQLIAVYKDENNKCHYFSPYCPHLKCIIQFNAKTKTWDCPCHGSTYDSYGNLMLGPSLYDLKKK